MKISGKIAVLTSGILAFGAAAVIAAQIEIVLAEAGAAKYPIVVAPSSSAQVREAAAELAGMLERISGAAFTVTEGDGSAGLALGAATDFSTLPAGFDFDPGNPLRREEYRLQTHADGLRLIGATPHAVDHAVWDFLHRLGYRLFFLTDTWEVVPDTATLRVALDLAEAPDFHTRQAPRGAPWSDGRLWNRWHKRNRVISAFVLHTGHAYGGIIRANREVYSQNPEFYALVNGQRRHAGRVDGGGDIKFCISNPELRRVIVDHAIRTVKADPGRDSISMDPSDGGHWCECVECAEMGSVSDRVVILANHVAEAINQLGLGPRYVGIYAYASHSPPPSIDVHPNVIVSLATSFIRGGHTIESMIEGWRAQAATLGIREYHDVFTWSHDMPRRARGGNLAYLRRTIPYFYQQGARFMNSENSDGWGANGLGYWVTPRLLWRVADADNLDELVDDFLNNAFGAAKPPMRKFYTLLNIDRSRQTSEHIIAMLYRHLDDARNLTAHDDAVLRRLEDLVLYTRYMDLYTIYRSSDNTPVTKRIRIDADAPPAMREIGDVMHDAAAPAANAVESWADELLGLLESDAPEPEPVYIEVQSTERQEAFEILLRHVYRMRDRMMLSTVAIYERERYRDRGMSIPNFALWSVPEADNPWKDSTPYTHDEINAIIHDGIAAHQPNKADFESREFSDDLIPATPLNPPADVPAGTLPLTGRGARQFLTWLETPGDIVLDVTGGLIAHYRDRGNVKISLYAAQEETLDAVAYDDSVPPDGKMYRVILSSPYPELHTLQVSDGSDRTRLEFPDGQLLTVVSGIDAPAGLPGQWSLYFYVPRGTGIVGGFSTSATGKMLDGAGHQVLDFGATERTGFFSVPVPEGQDGTFWRFEQCRGNRMLMTVPPYLARTPAELLLPREVVINDAQD